MRSNEQNREDEEDEREEYKIVMIVGGMVIFKNFFRLYHTIIINRNSQKNIH